MKNNKRNSAFSLAEAMVAGFIALSILLAVSQLSVATARIAGTTRNSGSLTLSGQGATDEIIYQLRGGTNILPSRTVNTVSAVTNASNVVFSTPGMDVANSDILTTVDDYVAFQYDAATGEVYETIAPGTGSGRARHTRFLLARNISSFGFTYRVREQFKTSVVPLVKTLKAATTGTPQVYVNGVRSTNFTYIALTKTLTVNNVAIGADVQVVYPVNPVDTVAQPHISEVEVNLTQRLTTNAENGQNVATTQVIHGKARLRNNRI